MIGKSSVVLDILFFYFSHTKCTLRSNKSLKVNVNLVWDVSFYFLIINSLHLKVLMYICYAICTKTRPVFLPAPWPIFVLHLAGSQKTFVLEFTAPWFWATAGFVVAFHRPFPKTLLPLSLSILQMTAFAIRKDDVFFCSNFTVELRFIFCNRC